MGEFVRIVEVGPRDGLQNEPRHIDVETKVQLIERLIGAGVKLHGMGYETGIDPDQLAEAGAYISVALDRLNMSRAGRALLSQRERLSCSS